MIQAPISNPPQAYLDILLPLIDRARGFLEAGETLAPMAFVGALESRQFVPVLMNTGSTEAKDNSAAVIERTARHPGGFCRHHHGSLEPAARQDRQNGRNH